MNVLVLGSGGREHALAWKIAQSDLLNKLFIAPGNAGTTALGENLDLSVGDFEGIKAAVLKHEIDLLVVGPEAPLVDGLRDFLAKDNDTKDLKVVGPSAKGAMLEGSKDFAKAFMKKYNIPTAAYQTFNSDNVEAGQKFLETLSSPYVLKADGLAAGKGVLIIDDLQEAKDELAKMLDGKFGSASTQVVIEEFLSGVEMSVFILTDGQDYVLLPEAKDYKRIGEGDTGLNTGGMGAISPVPFADSTFMGKVRDRIIESTVKGIREEGYDYRGFVFIGLINVGGDPFVIEYNVRMGDPETEVVIPRIKTDLLPVLEACADGKLEDLSIESTEEAATTVMLVSGGYPEAYEKGKVITGLDSVEGAVAFHAGTKSDGDKVVTSGGRVISVTAYGNHYQSALKKAYEQADRINFEGKYFRRDLGFDL